MALANRTKKTYKTFDLPLSYRINDDRDRFLSVSNVFSNQGRLETRYGMSRYNTTKIGDGSTKVSSISYFKDVADAIVVIAKVGTILYSVDESGSHTELKTGLTSTTVHRGLTLNNRHIISIGVDGLFQYDTANGFTQLGLAAPTAPTTALEAAGALSAADWLVKLTFYSTVTGFETNAGTAGTERTTSGGNLRVAVSAIPATADNATIDKVRVYASKDAGSYFFAAEISLGTTTYNLDADPTSSSTPPTLNAAPQAGGGKFLTEFNKKLVYGGNNTFKNDIFFSEQDLPDAFDDNGDSQLVLFASGNGAVTAIATGFFNDSNLDPYLVIFKRNRALIYSEIEGNTRLSVLSDTVGCLNDSTVEIRNGDVFFMSERGWHAIVNGRLVKDSKGNVLTLGNGDVDDIFTVGTGYENEINVNQSSLYHSVYYPRLDQYITWIAEGSSTDIKKAYVYEFSTSHGFKVYNFPMNIVSSSIAEDSNNNSIVLLGDESGYIYKHSIKESKSDVDSNNQRVKLNAFGILSWIDVDDFATTYNFRDIFLQQIGEDDDITVKGYINYDLADFVTETFEFASPSGGFILDLSKLDEGTFGDARAANVQYADINRSGQTFAVGFFLNKLDGRMSLIKAQIDFNKNGNRN